MKVIGIFISLVVLFSLSSLCIAATGPYTPEAALKRAFPQIKADSVRETDIAGMYEVIAGQNIFYYFPDKDYLFAGNIYSKDGKNLTAERREELMAKLIQTLPLDKAVRIGNGSKKVIEFSDPDCPYCRKAAEYFKNRTDIVQYVFFAPLAHPAAITKIQYILGSVNKEKAYKDMMEGKPLPSLAQAPTPAVKELAQEHLDLARKIGIQATPTFFINGAVVTGADIAKIDALLNEPASPKKEQPQ